MLEGELNSLTVVEIERKVDLIQRKLKTKQSLQEFLPSVGLAPLLSTETASQNTLSTEKSTEKTLENG